MNMLRSFVIIALLGLVGCSQSSSPTEPTWNSSINSKSLNYPHGQKFSLQPDLSADGGYQWDITMTDTNVVHVDSTSYRPKSGNPNQVGGLTIETFYFCTSKVGRSDISLAERRSWEQGIPAIDSVAFSVNVNH